MTGKTDSKCAGREKRRKGTGKERISAAKRRAAKIEIVLYELPETAEAEKDADAGKTAESVAGGRKEGNRKTERKENLEQLCAETGGEESAVLEQRDRHTNSTDLGLQSHQKEAQRLKYTSAK